MTRIRAALVGLALPLLIGATTPPPRPPVKAPVKAPVQAITKPAAKPAARVVKAAAKPAPKTPPVKASMDTATVKTYPPQVIGFPGGVTMTEMVYRQLPGFRALTLDLYASNAKGFPRPGLVFVHGGEWQGGDPRHAGGFGDLPGLLAGLAARGYVVASVDYRLAGEARFPGALQDVKSAIRWLRGHRGDFNLDDTRIAIWGVEAGGHLAALAGVSCGVAPLAPEDDARDKPSDCVQAVIDWSGFTDFESLAADLDRPAPDKSPAGSYLGCEPAMCPVGAARNASPLTYVTAMSPPFLIQHGQADTHVAAKQSQRLYDGLRAKSVPAELVIYPGAGRDFAAQAPEPVNAKAMEKLEAFLETVFPKKPASSPYNPPQRQALPY